jgi:hypothetical protein
MSFRTPRDAAHSFRDPLQQAIHCVTPAKFDFPREYPIDTPLKLMLGDIEPVRRSGDYPLLFSITIRFRVVAESPLAHRAAMTDYAYVIRHGNGRELLVYHWHPESRSDITFPHLHMKAGTDLRREQFAKAHIPTGWIALQDVVWLAITQFGARPAKKGWPTILRRTRTLMHLPVDDETLSFP